MVSFLSSATIFFPIPSHVIVFLFSVDNFPLLVGLIAALGSTFGEVISYFLGRGSSELLEKESKKWRKYQREIDKLTDKINKYGMFSMIALFAATPLPDDVLGIFAGIAEYDLKKFLLATFIGKAIMYVIIAYSGSVFWGWVL